MTSSFLGVSFTVWGIIGLAIAAIWIFVRTSHRAATPRWRFIVLRWFHMVVWLLLALAAFIAGSSLPGAAAIARLAALLSLLTYLIFMAALFTSKPA